MTINSDINIIGGLPDFNLILHFFENPLVVRDQSAHYGYTSIKTNKSVARFERAINETLLKVHNNKVHVLIDNMLTSEGISSDSLILLFWNASFNNQLLNYLNEQIYFPCFYSGRLSIKQDEVVACLKDLSLTEPELKKWSDSTISITASKYLTLLKKFNLMEGALHKTISHPYLNDKMLVYFVYWVSAIDKNTNFVNSPWSKYTFLEQGVLVDRLIQKKFSKYFDVWYTGDKLNIKPPLTYGNIYETPII
jgi:hypothetical protein